jgi:hypothetical protein
MRRLFWKRLVRRVRRSWKVKTGQSTTSFHPATGNPIMTSTTYNLYAEPVTDESKTAPSKEYNGSVQGSSKGMARRKSVWVRLLLVFNSLLPLSIRPIKSKRAHRRRYLGVRHRVFVFRMLWRSHWKNKLKDKLRLNK